MLEPVNHLAQLVLHLVSIISSVENHLEQNTTSHCHQIGALWVSLGGWNIWKKSVRLYSILPRRNFFWIGLSNQKRTLSAVLTNIAVLCRKAIGLVPRARVHLSGFTSLWDKLFGYSWLGLILNIDRYNVLL